MQSSSGLPNDSICAAARPPCTHCIACSQEGKGKSESTHAHTHTYGGCCCCCCVGTGGGDSGPGACTGHNQKPRFCSIEGCGCVQLISPRKGGGGGGGREGGRVCIHPSSRSTGSKGDHIIGFGPKLARLLRLPKCGRVQGTIDPPSPRPAARAPVQTISSFRRCRSAHKPPSGAAKRRPALGRAGVRGICIDRRKKKEQNNARRRPPAPPPGERGYRGTKVGADLCVGVGVVRRSIAHACVCTCVGLGRVDRPPSIQLQVVLIEPAILALLRHATDQEQI